MSKLSLLACLLVALGASGGALDAQASPWSSSFKLGVGALGGDTKKALDNSTSFSFAFEGAYSLSDRGSLVGDVGYRFFAGSNTLLSFIPISVAATGVNPTYYETRNRRTDAKGFQLTGLYRYELLPGQLYLQGGLRLGQNKAAETDTGTRLTTDGTAIANTGSITNSHILGVSTIASSTEQKTLAVGLLVGAGYHFGERYSAELNVFNTRIETASGGARNGTVLEAAFSVRF